MPGIREIHIENFRCLKQVDVALDRLTIFVGPNAVGKTSLIDALERTTISVDDVWQRQGSQPVVRRGTLGDGQKFNYVALPNATVGFHWNLHRVQFLPGELRKTLQLSEQKQFSLHGDNLVNVFATLPRPTRDAIAKKLCELIPFYSDVDTKPVSQGTHRLVFRDRWDESRDYPPEQVSDGTMMMLAFLTLTHLNPAPDIIAVEDPESSLHPYLVGEVVGMLRKLSRGELGARPIQVILTTHSAALLNFAEPTEVRFMSRDLETGETRIEAAPTESAQWAAAFAEYDRSLGEVWLSGGVGGVPGAPPGQ